MGEDVVEQTLHITRSVDVYQIPPRGPSGWKSGEWLVSSKIFSGRLKVVSLDEVCEIRLEDANSGELFACCPMAYGMRTICVEPVADSSRYFVFRVEDPVSKRHAFLGVGFAERGEAFDFNESLVRHEKWCEREKAAQTLQQDPAAAPAAPGTSGKKPSQSIQAASATKEVASLYAQHGDLGLHEGQTIHVNLKKKEGAAVKSSWLTAGGPTVSVAAAAPASGGSGLFKLAPPPADTAPSASPVPSTAWPVLQPPPPPAPQVDLLGQLTAPQPTQQPPATNAQSDWAVFD